MNDKLLRRSTSLIGGALIGLMLVGVASPTARVPLSSNKDHSSNSELQEDIAHLKLLAKSGNLDSVVASIDRNSLKWRSRDRNDFKVYIFEACSLLGSYDIGNVSERALLLGRYAASVLKTEDLAIEENVQFVEFLTLDPPTMNEAAWRTLRSEKASFWLAAVHRVAGATNPKFNFDDKPYLNVPAPAGLGLPAGVAPESIADPMLRAGYERAVAVNTTKTLQYNEQFYLKRTAPRFYMEAEEYLVSAYSRAPADREQLEQLLSKYVVDKAMRDRVLFQVPKRN
jgi:hypothetical protein